MKSAVLYTYMHVLKAQRMYFKVFNCIYSQFDPQLENYRKELIVSVAKKLDQARMIRFVEHTGALHATDLGRTASHFYINYASIVVRMYCMYVQVHKKFVCVCV